MSALMRIAQNLVRIQEKTGRSVGLVSLEWFRKQHPDIDKKTRRNRVADLTTYPEERPMLRRIGRPGNGVYLVRKIEMPWKEAILRGDDVYTMRLKGEKKEPRTVREKREALREHAWPLIAEQDGRCGLCERQRLDSPVDCEIDHIEARSQGGILLWAVCIGCHRYKGAGTVEECRARLRELGVPIDDPPTDLPLRAAIEANRTAPTKWFGKKESNPVP